MTQQILNSKFQNAMQLFNPVVLSYGRDSSQLVSDIRDNKQGGVDGNISMSFGA